MRAGIVRKNGYIPKLSLCPSPYRKQERGVFSDLYSKNLVELLGVKFKNMVEGRGVLVWGVEAQASLGVFNSQAGLQ